MKACPQHQQNLALLTAEILETAERRALEAHVANCPGCRSYLRELSEICREHSTAVENLPPAEASDQFHQRLVRRIEASTTVPARREESLIQTLFADWRGRIALATGAAMVVFIVLVNLPRPRSEVVSLTPAPDVQTAINLAQPDAPATLLAYRRAAKQSPEALDALLAHDGARSPSPSLRVTAFTRDLATLTD